MTTRITITLPSRSLVLGGVLALGVGLGFGVARAGVPADADALVYSGVLEENGLLVEGPRAIALELFDVPVGGTNFCRVAPGAVDVVAGRFRIALTGACATSLRSAGDAAFVEVRVADVAVGARTRIGAVPFAVEAGRASSVAPGAVGQAEAPFAPTVTGGGAAVSAPKIFVVTGVQTLTPGLTSQTFDVDVSAAAFTAAPLAGVAQVTSAAGFGFIATYDHGVDPATAVVTIVREGGGVFSLNTIRFDLILIGN